VSRVDGATPLSRSSLGAQALFERLVMNTTNTVPVGSIAILLFGLLSALFLFWSQ
jgi:hypothetical protein